MLLFLGEAPGSRGVLSESSPLFLGRPLLVIDTRHPDGGRGWITDTTKAYAYTTDADGNVTA